MTVTYRSVPDVGDPWRTAGGWKRNSVGRTVLGMEGLLGTWKNGMWSRRAGRGGQENLTGKVSGAYCPYEDLQRIQGVKSEDRASGSLGS